MAKINRELLWKKHEMIVAQNAEWAKWYDKVLPFIQNLDEERQKIVRKYFQFEDGELKQNDQQQYVLLKGMKMEDWDAEMANLMSGEQEIPD